MVPIYLDFLSKFGVGGAHPGGFELTKALLMNEELDAMSEILDVGCGTGQTAAFLAAQSGANVTGVDINPIMVEKATHRMKEAKLPVRIFQGSIEALPLEDEKFDLIMCESVLTFVNQPKALKEIFRLLKKGGRFISNEFTANVSPPPWIADEINRFYGINSVLTEAEWQRLFEGAGFTNIRVSGQNQSMLQYNPNPDFLYSKHIEPELYTVMNEHFNLLLKYNELLGYRIFACGK
ncbi:class I SAM-dependent methyltransferase [Cytobacillus sp. FSL R5-0569]|uniref:class I SAM-dependent methyltransferase n=1 Tax=Cytobacillus sp. FSL R5-0569 TaxID=2921649 RepID=UPI0030F52BD7